ncbi:MAG: class I SAM-dependent methyltransferase [Ktedonobacteraceae bacterium]|nr:class I SAM-dependent methyltransferase [Ktedonobacteraceae bacterium]
MNQSNQSTQTYVLGSSSEETQRLQKQAQMYLPITQRFLQEAGITAGMKVLEVGSGAGDISLLVAELVGPSGTVVGVDRNPEILETARARMQAAGHTNVSFIVEDITNLTLDTDFDAVVGRFILGHLFSDPVVALRNLVRHLRPGGIVAFQEADLTHLGTSFPPSPLFEQAGSWIREGARRAGLDYQLGFRLYSVFLDAGLPEPQMSYTSPIGGGSDWVGYDVMAELVRSMLPEILKFHVATAEEIDIDTLAQRLRDSMANRRGVARWLDVVSAWTRTT